MTSVVDKIKAQQAREMYLQKQKAIEFYSENGVPQKMEAILNKTFYDNPNDVYGHVVSIHLANLSFPGVYLRSQNWHGWYLVYE